MALIEDLLPWLSQPQEVVVARPEWVRCYNAGVGLKDVSQRGDASVSVGSRVFDAGSAGLALVVNAGLEVSTGEIVPDISSGITAVWIAEKNANILGSSDFLWGEQSTATGPYNWGFYEPAGNPTNLQFYVHNGTAGAAAGATGQWATGQGPQVWVGTYGDGDNTVRLYCNGVQVGSAAQTGNVQRNAASLLRAAYWNGSTPNFKMYAAAVSNRRMSPAEIAERFGSITTAWDALFEPRLVIAFSSSVASVTSDFTSTFTISESITSDLAQTYALINSTEADLSESYSVLGATESDLAATYTVINAVEADLAQTYTVIAGVESDLAATYTVTNAVESDLAQTYTLINAASADLAASYTVINSVEADLAQTYAINGAAQSDLAATYTVINAVEADLAQTYAINGEVQSDLAAIYALIGTVEADLAQTYSVENETVVTSDLAQSYTIIAGVQGDLSQTYAINGTVQADLAANYSLINSIQADLVQSFDVLAPVQSDLGQEFAVIGTVSADLAQTYILLAAVESDLAATYTLFSSSGGTGASVEEIWQHAIEGGMTAEQMLRVILAAVSGTTTGVGTSQERYMSKNGAKPRITADFDTNSNRIAVTVDGT